MKRILRTYLFHLFALWLSAQLIASSFSISGSLENWLIAAGVLAILNLLLKPILTLLFFPINALSLGLFSLVINAGVFYVFMRLVSHVHITSWTFPGIFYQGIRLPQTTLPFVGTLFVVSLLVSLITNFLAFLVE